jgi:antitoxin Phd
MTKWQLQDAKSRFSELIDDTLEKGPQVVTRRGVDTAVVVSIDEWKKLKNEKRVTWKEVLLEEGPRFEITLPKRGKRKSRKAPVFDLPGIRAINARAFGNVCRGRDDCGHGACAWADGGDAERAGFPASGRGGI